MAEDVRDVLMKFTIKGSDVTAESSAVVDPEDKMASTFQAASKDNQWKGNFFSLRDFKMDMGLLGDSAGDPAAQMRQQAEQMKLMQEAVKKNLDEMNLAATRSGSDFASFMEAPSGGSTKSFSANLEPVTFTKYLDIASLALFDACVKSTTIDQAVMIKRRGGGASHLRTYLRIEFTDLLITDFNWDEDDVVTEKISFVCRSAAVLFRAEQHSGNLRSPIQKYEWSVTNLGGKSK